MKILVTYASNSGSTEMCAQIISKELEEAKHSVTLKKATQTKPDDLSNYDLVLIGSPSWDYEKKEGMPHEDIMEFFKKCENTSFDDKKFAVFGCGDRSYTFFAGAVDKISEMITAKKGPLVCEPLKIDSFYFDMDKNVPLVQKWAQKLTKAF